MKDFARGNYFSMLNELAFELGEYEISSLAPDERTNRLRMTLVGKKALIVFDNLETLSEDERTRLFQFLSRLPEGNKAVVTSRRRADVDARLIRLDRLSAREALQLMEELVRNNSRLARENEEARRNLYEIANGNPLLIKWVCGQLGREGSIMHTIKEACEFVNNAPEGNDPLEYIFGDLLETFTESEIKVLAALTHFSRPAKLKWISEITQLSEKVAETALQDLDDRSLLISGNEAHEYFLPPLAAQFIRTKRMGTVHDLGDQLANIVYLIIAKNDKSEQEMMTITEKDWILISAGITSIITKSDANLYEICEKYPSSVDMSSHMDEYILLCNQAEKQARTSKEYSIASNVAHMLVTSYVARKQSKKARECLSRFKQYVKKSDSTALGILYFDQSEVYRMENRYTLALKFLLKAQKTWGVKNQNYRLISVGLLSLARLQRLKRNYKMAEKNYRRAIQILISNRDSHNLAYIIDGLAELELDRGKWSDAESTAKTALLIATKTKDNLSASLSYKYIARALLKQGKYRRALSYAQRALTIVSNYGNLDMSETENLLTECKQAIQSKTTKKNGK